MNFRSSFCDPLKPDVIELGDIAVENIIPAFEKVPWKEFLDKTETASEDEIYYSPSLEIENKITKYGLSISAIRDDNKDSFFIFYKRPKIVSSFFGLKKKNNENYFTEIMDQTTQDAIDCLNALIRGDVNYLENKIGK